MARQDEFTLSCPIPISQYPQILLAHGGGGKLMHQLIEKIFGAAFANEYLDERHDGAVLDLPPRPPTSPPSPARQTSSGLFVVPPSAARCPVQAKPGPPSRFDGGLGQGLGERSESRSPRIRTSCGRSSSPAAISGNSLSTALSMI
jgi:hypothetical protein